MKIPCVMYLNYCSCIMDNFENKEKGAFLEK